jgi:hypothetical protein
VSSGSGAHPAACPMGSGVPFPGGKARQGSDADHSPHLVPRSWMSRSYTSSHPCASISVLWDCFTFTIVYSTLCNDNYRLQFQNFRWILTELGVNVIPLSPSKLLLWKFLPSILPTRQPCVLGRRKRYYITTKILNNILKCCAAEPPKRCHIVMVFVYKT